MTGLTSYQLWLPSPPDNANGRDHWAVAARKRKAYQRELDHRALARIIPPAPWAVAPEHVTIELCWHYPDGRWHIDPDNMIRRLKPAIDWMVTVGHLPGDTADLLTILPPTSRVRAPTPPASTVLVTIWPTRPPADILAHPSEPRTS